jgi:hypothetical protein
MKNRNLLLFIVLSVALLGAYSILMNRVYPPKPMPKVQELQPAVSAPIQESAQAVAGTTPAPALNAKAVFTLSSNALELTWRKQDGALVQAVWKKDGTSFFPWEHVGKEGRLTSLDFPGIGGSTGAIFTGEPQVTRQGAYQDVAFLSPSGDRLTYRIPDDGHVLDVAFSSPQGNHLYLVRTLADMPQVPDGKGGQYEVNPFHNLGKVFTLEDGKIERVEWTGMMKDPFFSFLGFKRKTLPATSISRPSGNAA